jgi:hypothetical protein
MMAKVLSMTSTPFTGMVSRRIGRTPVKRWKLLENEKPYLEAYDIIAFEVAFSPKSTN